jgi:reactive intermediate/imine deaminase
MQIVSTPNALPPLPSFSQAVISKGHVYVSGNIGLAELTDATNFKLAEGGVKGQVRTALENLSKVLKASGSGLEHIVKANVFLTDLPKDFGPMNEVYVEFFDKDKMPARTCIGVKNLPLGAAFEIECIAEIAGAAM